MIKVRKAADPAERNPMDFQPPLKHPAGTRADLLAPAQIITKKISHFPTRTSLPTKILEQNHSKSLKTFSNFQQSAIHGQGQFRFTSEMKPSR